MNKPNPYLMQVGQGVFGMPAPPPGSFDQQVAAAFGGGPPVSPPPPAPIALPGAPAPVDMAPPPPAPGPPPPPAGPPPAPPPPPPPAAPQQPPPMPDLQRVPGGVTPAREVDVRGPSLRAAQGRANEAETRAVGKIDENSQSAALVEYATALDMQRKAQAREDAAMRAAAEREEEMAHRQADFDQSVKALSQASVDPERFWASRSTGQKILAIIGVTLGGYVQGVRGGSNVGLDVLNAQIDRDIKAQEFTYNATRDTVHAKQTAFSMAMQKYQNVDAARALARAAALDSVQAQLMQNAALWKGTESANRAQAAMAQIEQMKAQQVAQGIRFLPASVGPTKYVDPRTGLVYTEQEAHALDAERRQHNFEMQKIDRTGGWAVTKEEAQQRAAGDKDARASLVQLPNGDMVRAPSGEEGQKLRAAAASVHETRALVNEAKQILEDSSWRTSPSRRGRMEQIQADLKVQFKNQAQLGALSKDDYELAMEGTVDLFSVGPGKESRLDRIHEKAERGVRNMVKTYPDAPASAQGKMPASFTPHGK